MVRYIAALGLSSHTYKNMHQDIILPFVLYDFLVCLVDVLHLLVGAIKRLLSTLVYRLVNVPVDL